MSRAEVTIHQRLVTVPNALCVIRGIGSFAMLPLAASGNAVAVLVLYLCLASTDWVDGKIARWLDQRSEIGPKLDSIADVMMYGCLAVSLVILRPDVFAEQWGWVAVAVTSYLFSCGLAWRKFGKLPSYHTRSAKVSFGLMLIAVVSLLLSGPSWPLIVAMVMVTVANVESIWWTTRLDRPVTDVTEL